MSEKIEIIYTVDIDELLDFVSLKDNASINKIKTHAEAATLQKLLNKFRRGESMFAWTIIVIFGLIVAAYVAKLLLAPHTATGAEIPSAINTLVNTATHSLITKTITQINSGTTTTFTTVVSAP